MMEREIIPGLLADESGVHASVKPGLRSVTVSPRAGKSLTAVRTLEIPESVESFAGIEQFRNLRRVRYAGASDVFSFEEPLLWLGKNAEDLDAFTVRLATNLLAFRPAPLSLCAITAPNMPPIHAGRGWKRLITAMEERLRTAGSSGAIRQDASREYVILCRSYTVFKHLQCAFALGRAISGEAWAPEAEAAYGAGDALTPERQLGILLAMGQGHSYEELTGATGDRRVELMKEPRDYADFLRREVRWTEGEAFQRTLSGLLEDGLITAVNYPALLDELSMRRMTASAALAIRYGAGHPELRTRTEEDDFFS